VVVVLANVRPTCTTRDLEEGIIRCFKKKTLKRGLHINGATRKSIYEKTSCGERIIPI
jgi:hypothetical protein